MKTFTAGVVIALASSTSLAAQENSCAYIDELVRDGAQRFASIKAKGEVDGDLNWKLPGASRCYMGEPSSKQLGEVWCVWSKSRFADEGELNRQANGFFKMFEPCFKAKLSEVLIDDQRDGFYSLMGITQRHEIAMHISTSTYDTEKDITFSFQMFERK